MPTFCDYRVIFTAIQYGPVLLKDSDDTYVGAWPEKVKELKETHKGLQDLPKQQVISVLEDLWEAEQKERAAAVGRTSQE